MRLRGEGTFRVRSLCAIVAFVAGVGDNEGSRRKTVTGHYRSVAHPFSSEIRNIRH